MRVLSLVKPSRVVQFQKRSRRNLSIHEHQSMSLLSQYGIPVPEGQLVTTAEDAYKAAQTFGSDDFVIKAQVLAGGRGKGVFDSGIVGGVQLATSPEEVRDISQKMIGRRLTTKQTGSQGRPCNSVLITERLYLRKEFYLALLLDRKSHGITLMGSCRGGMDIEAVARDEPNAIICLALPTEPEDVGDERLGNFIERIGVSSKNILFTIKIVKNMIQLFKEKDATLLEINPFVETSEGKMVCLDAKLNFDDNADFRQLEIFSLRDPSQEDAREVRAAEFKLNYIGLDGQIGCLVNGAGLAMATMDIIKLHGGNPANFLDVGGSATADQVEQAINILAEDPAVKSILVNIFGGIMRCDVIAEGILRAVKKRQLNVPLIVRLLGTNVDEAKKMIKESNMEVFACDDLDDAAQKAVTLSKIVDLADSAKLKVQINID